MSLFTVFVIITALELRKALKAKEKLGIVGFGSPIIDCLINADENQETGREIKREFQYHMTSDKINSFYSQLISSHPEKTLGGSALNSIRMVNYVILKSKLRIESKFLGAIGDDANGEFIVKSLQKEGVSFVFQKFKGEVTSSAIVLIENKEREFFVDLGCSAKLELSFLQKNFLKLSSAQIFFADAYLIGQSFQIFEFIFARLAEKQTLIALSLASKFIIRDYYDKIFKILPFVDILFFNKHECRLLMKMMDFTGDTPAFLEFLATFPLKVNKKKRSIIVNTQGKDNSLIYVYDHKTQHLIKFDIPVYRTDVNIVDTNGAGDAFSAGFLSHLIMNPKDPNYFKAAKLGNYLASLVLEVRGFQLPGNIDLNNPYLEDIQ